MPYKDPGQRKVVLTRRWDSDRDVNDPRANMSNNGDSIDPDPKTVYKKKMEVRE
jgi:hypothetical protein